MQISQNGLELIKRFEGCVLHAYKVVDTERYFTIGYGHYSQAVKENQVITKEEAEELLKYDLKGFEYGVSKMVKVPINQNMFDSLVCLSFNIGLGAFGSSTLLEKLNQRDIKGASKEFERWVHASGRVLQGLVKRRKAEKELFLKEEVKPKTKPKEHIIKYTVKSGDTLSEIALKYNTTIERILKLNPTIKNKHIIFVNQVLKIPKN